MEATTLNERVRSLFFLHRVAAGITQERMAGRLHMPETDYRCIEAGEQADIDPRLVIAFCKALKMPIHRFLLAGKHTNPHYATIITEHWTMICQLRENQEQMLQLLEMLQE